jgi:hypothetical protein
MAAIIVLVIGKLAYYGKKYRGYPGPEFGNCLPHPFPVVFFRNQASYFSAGSGNLQFQKVIFNVFRMHWDSKNQKSQYERENFIFAYSMEKNFKNLA